ncbi:hypothetical protein [Endozoicomonas sp. SCSIO W0465]|nr:hypothetical protein [Endozoicomonas sp. SCSIO W0465]USE37408.1 hypothetical protein MJO57_04055 [Endozoicomonas sp. SCSIO W0465]
MIIGYADSGKTRPDPGEIKQTTIDALYIFHSTFLAQTPTIFSSPTTTIS